MVIFSRLAILPRYFEVVQSDKQQNELKIVESIDVHRFKPTLNEMVASVPLNILNRMYFTQINYFAIGTV